MSRLNKRKYFLPDIDCNISYYNPEPIKLLESINFLAKDKMLFLLGAGVSSRYIDINYNHREKVKKILKKEVINDWKLNILPDKLRENECERYKTSNHDIELHEYNDGRIYINDTDYDVYDLIFKFYPDIWYLSMLLSYSLDIYPEQCPEYEIFNYFNMDSLIVNYNHDNLARAYLRNTKRIIELHGSITAEERKMLNSIYSYAIQVLKEELPNIFYLISNRYLSKFVLAKKECETLIMTPLYQKLETILEKNYYRAVCCIGYSFFYQNHQILDEVSYKLIKKYIKHTNSILISIAPEAEKILDLFYDCGWNKKIGYSIYWDQFTYALYCLGMNKFLLTDSKIDLTLKKQFLYLYERTSKETFTEIGITQIKDFKNLMSSLHLPKSFEI